MTKEGDEDEDEDDDEVEPETETLDNDNGLMFDDDFDATEASPLATDLHFCLIN